MKTVLLLGAGSSQVNAIRRLKSMGHRVVVSDYFPDPLGKHDADYHEQVSTFDPQANLTVARKHRIDAVFTLGTDQPVYTATVVAQQLGLPSPLTVATAKAVTNKQIMKDNLAMNRLPTVNYRLVSADFSDRDLDGLRCPLVVKPLDSQGQRGVYKLDSATDVRRVFEKVLCYSRENRILVEEYYPSDEITVSGWVVDGRVYLISIVDRVSFPDPTHIGVCIRHRFPSKYLKTRGEEIEDLTRRIVAVFKIENGPIYFQMLIGAEGIKINEIACRLGGAYEDEYLLKATGIDILGMQIASSFGERIDATALQSHDFRNPDKAISVELFFVHPGIVNRVSDIEQLKQLDGIIQACHFLKPGDRCEPMENATARAGYMIVAGRNESQLAERLDRAYQELGVFKSNGENMIIRF